MDAIQDTSLLTRAALLSALPPAQPGGDASVAAGHIQLFPAGAFAARDGRPGNLKGVTAKAWRLTPEDADALLALWRQRATPVVVDYEHQTHLSRENGQPAPAAGWITALEATPEGLFASVEWTDKARAHIRAGEYRFISPTFSFDRRSGAVLELHSAALTNNPALDGMDPASAKLQALRQRKLRMETAFDYAGNDSKKPLSPSVRLVDSPTPDATHNTQEDKHMDKLLALLRTLLGLPDTADEAQCAEALSRHLPQQNLITLLKSKDDALATAQAELAGAKAAPPDPGKYVALATFQAVQQEAAQLRAKLAEMEGAAAVAALSGEIEAALKDGRLAASAKPWAEGLAKSNPDALREFLKSTPPVTALKGTQTGGKEPDSTPGTASLTAEEEYARVQLGLTAEEYAKHKKESV